MGLYLVGSSYKDPGQIKLAWKRPLFEDNSEFDAKEVILILSWIRTIERIWYFHFMLMMIEEYILIILSFGERFLVIFNLTWLRKIKIIHKYVH